MESSVPAAPAGISRLLLVRLRQIGDVVFTTPAVRALRQRFPDAHISYLVEPAAAPVVAHNPHIDEVIIAPRTGGPSGLGAEAALIRRLRAGSYDVAIDFHGGPRASLLTWLSGARVRIGYDTAGRGWMYTRRVDRPRELRARHSVENQWDLLAPFDIAPREPAAFPVEMPVAPSDATAVDERLARAGVPRGGRVIVMHVSAGNPRDLRIGTPRIGSSRRLGLDSPSAIGTGCSRAATSHLPISGRSSIARRSTSAATAGRCTSPPPVTCRSWRCTDRRCRRGPRPGARRTGRRSRSRSTGCRAGRAISGRARPATSGASPGFNPSR